jgi:hypothetical protein
LSYYVLHTIKPNSVITITPKAGTGHSASSNPSTLTAPATHTVNTTEIVKDYGSNVAKLVGIAVPFLIVAVRLLAT